MGTLSLMMDQIIQPLALNWGQQKSHLDFAGIPPNKNPTWILLGSHSTKILPGSGIQTLFEVCTHEHVHSV